MTSTNADPEPIRLILEDADVTGWVRTEGQRMTDILQAGEPFSFMPAGGEPGQWTEIFPDDVVLAVPPPHVSPPEQRLPRNQHEVMIRAGAYGVVGTAHLRPGEQDDPILRATRRFLPLTDATFGHENGLDEHAEVVIVNLRRTSEFNIA
jgi:hypothetical protein